MCGQRKVKLEGVVSMLNIIICDDNKRDLERITKIVDKFMKNNKYE